MVEVSRDTKKWFCISCTDRTKETHEIRIGGEDNNKLVINLCPDCLDDLCSEIAETLNY